MNAMRVRIWCMNLYFSTMLKGHFFIFMFPSDIGFASGKPFRFTIPVANIIN